MNVIVSMISVEGKKVYHRPDCVYVKRMKPQNRMSFGRLRRRIRRCEGWHFVNDAGITKRMSAK